MVQRRGILCIGQSNAGLVGDAHGWEDALPQWSIRSPQHDKNILPTASQGAYSDTIRLTGTFPGGRQTGQLGDSTIGDWSTLDYSGVGATGIRFLTHYNAMPVFFTWERFSQTYPGTATVLPGSQPAVLETDRLSQPVERQNITGVTVATPGVFTIVGHGFANTTGQLVAFGSTADLPGGLDGKHTYEVVYVDADNFQVKEWPYGTASVATSSAGSGTIYITRAEQGFIYRPKTGTSHQAACGRTGSNLTDIGRYTLNISPPFDPAPEDYEPFQYDILSGQDSTATDEVIFNHRVGGIPFNGSESRQVKIRQPDGDNPAMVTWTEHEAYVGRIFQFANTITPQIVTSVDTGTNTLTLGAHTLVEDQLVEYISAAGTIGGLSTGTPYYVVNRTSSTVQLAALPQGTPINVTSHSGLPVLQSRTPPGLVAGSNYWITSLADEKASDIFLALPSSVNTGTGVFTFLTDTTLVEGERITIAPVGDGSTMPTGLVEGQSYWVRLNGTASQFQIADTFGGAPISSFASGGAGTIQILRPELQVSFHISDNPGGEELKLTGTRNDVFTYMTGRMAEIFRGSLTGLQLECTVGTNLGETRNLMHASYTGGPGGDLSIVHLETGFSSNPQRGDQYAIRVPPVNGVTREFKTWAKLLPWCPFEGQADGYQPSFSSGGVGSVVSETVEGDLIGPDQGQFYFSLTASQPGQAFKIYGADLPEPLVSGQKYYVTLANPGGASFFSDTYGGENVRQRWVTVTNISSNVITVDQDHRWSPGDPIRFFGDGVTAAGITEGTVYYLDYIDARTFRLLGVPGGSVEPLNDLDTPGAFYSTKFASGDAWGIIVEGQGRSNPAPPGFNFPNHNSAPGAYQPFEGQLVTTLLPRISHSVSTAFYLQQHWGERVCVAQTVFPGTSIGHKEVPPLPLGRAFMWLHGQQQISWAPGEGNSCTARMVDVLESFNLAAAEDGDTVSISDVFWFQGEEDARLEQLAPYYAANLRRFIAYTREQIKENGLWTGDPSHIRWHMIYVDENVGAGSPAWPYAAQVNAAMDEVAQEDPYVSIICSKEEMHALTKMADLVHHDGAGLAQASAYCLRSVENAERMGDIDVDICNQALRLLGDPGKITSISPPDEGSRQAELCAANFAAARDLVLEMHPFDFATRTVSPLEAVSDRPEWAYAYEVPTDMLRAVKVLPKDAPNDYVTGSDDIRGEYEIMTTPAGVRLLYSNTPELQLRYVFRATDTRLYTRVAVDAVAAQLAARMAPSYLEGNDGVEAGIRMQQLADERLRRAKSFDTSTTRNRPLASQKYNGSSYLDWHGGN